MRARRSAAAGALLLAALACSEQGDPPLEPPIEDLTCGRPELMYAVRGPDGGRFGGLDGALDPGTQARLLDAGGLQIAGLVADEHGRFEVGHEASAGEALTLEVCGVQVDFRVRDPERAREASVRSSLGGVGAVPNDLIVVGSPADSRGVVVRSGDNAVSQVGWSAGLEGAPLGVRLPSVPGALGPVAANPYLVTALDAGGGRVAVTAWSQDVVYVVDLATGAVERALDAPESVTLDAPFELPDPFDVDGDGLEESTVSAFAPRNPQPVAVVEGRLLVGYATILRVDRGGDSGQRQLALPAVIASFDLSNLDAPPAVAALDVLNPQEIRASPNGEALVTCSGLFRIDGLTPTSAGAVLRLDPLTLEVVGAAMLPTHLPTTAIEAAGKVWVGSLASSRVVSFAWATPEVQDVLTLDDAPVDSVFRLFSLPGGLLGAPSFNTDRLYVIDPRRAEVSPPPFYGPLQVGPGGDIFAGLQIVARRPGRAGVDWVGPDLMALEGLSASVTPIELRKVLGP